MRSKIWNVILKIPLPVLSYLVAIAMIWGISIFGGILCGTALFVYGIVVQYSEATFASGFLWFFCPMFFLWNTMYYIKTQRKLTQGKTGHCSSGCNHIPPPILVSWRSMDLYICRPISRTETYIRISMGRKIFQYPILP